jgi:hypothetical protein
MAINYGSSTLLDDEEDEKPVAPVSINYGKSELLDPVVDTPVNLQKIKDAAGDIAAEAGGATAGQIVGAWGGPLAPITVPLGGMVGGAIGNTVKQYRQMARGERENFSWGDFAGTTATSAIPGSGLVKAVFKGTGARAVAGNVLKAGAEGAALAGAQTVVTSLIDKHELPSWGEVRFNASGGMLFGAGIGTVGAIGKRLLGKTAAEAKPILKEAMESAQSEAERVKLTELQQLIDDKLGIKPKVTRADAAAQAAERASAMKEALNDHAAVNQSSTGMAGLKDRLLTEQVQAERKQAKMIDLAAEVDRAKAMEAPPAAYAAADRAQLSPQASRMMEEYGRVNPKAMQAMGFAAARAGTGFAVGSQVGETPEEKLANGLLFATGGAVASPALAKKIGSKIASTQAYRTSLATVLPEAVLGELMGPIRSLPGVKASLERDGYHALDSLKKALKDDPAASEGAFQYLTGNNHITNLPPEVAMPAQKVRDSIDALTDKMIDVGLATGTKRDTFIANQGRYMRRAYKLFEDPKYKPAEKDFTAFVDKYVAEEVANGSQVPVKELTQAGQDTAYRLLAKGKGTAFDAAEGFVRDGVIISKSGELFKPKKNLDEVTRKLLGEIQDPIDAAAQTIPRMAKILASDDAQNKMRELGLKTGLFSPQSAKGFEVPLAGEDSQSLDKLKDLWTSKDVQKAFSSTMGMNDWGPMWNTLATATSFSKFGKTVLNPESYAPNLISAVLEPLKNGHIGASFDGSNLKNAKGIILDELGIATAPKSLEKDIRFLTEQRVLNESVNFRDLSRTLEGASMTIPGAKATKKVLNGAAKVYGSSESLGRILTFYGEKQRYQAAFPNMPEEAINLKAAEMTRAVATNYSEIPGMVKKLSGVGVMPSFVNFTYEQFRTTYNAAKIGMDDVRQGMATKNPELIKAGQKRLAALTAMVAGGSAWGLSAYSKRQAGVDDQQEAALRRRVPSYDQTGIWYMHELTPGQFAYSNQSYVLPSSVVGEAVSAAARGDSPVDAAKAFGGVILNQFGGDGGVIFKPAFEALMDENAFGRRISTPEASKGQQIGERAGYFLDRSFTPIIVSQAEKWGKAMRGEKGPDGQEYRLGDRFDRLMGARVNRLNLPYRFEREAYGFSSRLQDLGRSVSGMKKQDPAKAESVMEEGRQKIFTDIMQYVEDAQTLQQDPTVVLKNLKNAGLPAPLLLSVLDGKYMPAPLDDGRPTASQIVAQLKEMPAQQMKAEFNRLVLSDAVMASSVKNAYRADAKATVLGLTERDKLIMALNVPKGERARYIQARVDDMATPEERQALLQEFKRKGIINKEVLYQLTKAGVK